MKRKKDKKSKKFLAIIITDFQGHTSQHRNPKSFLSKILSWTKNKKPLRWYSEDTTTGESNNKMATINIDQLKATLEEETGKTVRFFIKKHDSDDRGVDLYPGKDAMEKLESIKKKRRALTRVWRDDKLK